MVLHLVYVMILVFGKQKLGDVFQRNCMMQKHINLTHFLPFVTVLSLTVLKDTTQKFVQIKMKVVKAMVKKSISSV